MSPFESKDSLVHQARWSPVTGRAVMSEIRHAERADVMTMTSRTRSLGKGRCHTSGRGWSWVVLGMRHQGKLGQAASKKWDRSGRCCKIDWINSILY
jgi:hypothetical protein